MESPGEQADGCCVQPAHNPGGTLCRQKIILVNSLVRLNTLSESASKTPELPACQPLMFLRSGSSRSPAFVPGPWSAHSASAPCLPRGTPERPLQYSPSLPACFRPVQNCRASARCCSEAPTGPEGCPGWRGRSTGAPPELVRGLKHESKHSNYWQRDKSTLVYHGAVL